MPKSIVAPSFLLSVWACSQVPVGRMPIDSHPRMVQTIVSTDCLAGSDSTSTVQSAMRAGTCLPPGRYVIDMAPLGVTGRRRDAMLTGGTLCGVEAAETTVVFRGDAGGLLWEGIADADVHDLVLDSSCVSNTIEQAHLIHLTTGHAIHDVRLVHPKRESAAGDDINVVGSQTSPMVGLAIDHVQFDSCARFGVQISRGVQGGHISDSTFGPGCGIGSEGSGAIDGLTISHDAFASDGLPTGLALDIQRQTNLLLSHLAVHGHGIFLFHCDGCVVEHTSVDSLVPGLPTDIGSAISVNDVAHRVRLSDVTLVQPASSVLPAVRVGPLRPDRQADLADITVTSSTITQLSSGPFVGATGVTGISVTESTLLYGPTDPIPPVLLTAPSGGVAPAVSVPTTGATEAGNTLAPAAADP